MKASRPVAALAVAFAAFAAGGAAAQEGQGVQATPEAAPRAHDARAAPAPQPEHRRGDPAATRKPPPPRRRSVQQIIATVPPPPLAGPSYGPALAPRPPAPGVTPVYPPPPAALGTCQGSACTDAAGGTYYGGVGNAVISSQGRLCSRTGQTVQCF